jgi:hypothetical protein
MNTRGIVQLVVLNIGVQLNVISPIIFAMFVLMATILTFLTSPLLYILYRKDFDIKKLSQPNVAEDLQSMKEEGIDMSVLQDNVQTIPDGEMGTNEQRRSSVKFSRQSSSLPKYDTLITTDEPISYPEIDPNIMGHQQLAVLGNLVRMPTCPTRSVNMTRF